MRSMLVICAMMATILTTPALAQTDPVWSQRLFDVRDLGASMEQSRFMSIIERIAEALDVEMRMLDDGLLIVSGDTTTLNTFNDMVASLKALFEETYTIELRAAVVAIVEAPEPGSRFEGGEPLYLTRQTVTRRVMSTVASTRSQDYVSDVTPVVGDQSVGFDPTISQATSGIEAKLIVGADEEVDERTLVTIRGNLEHTTVERFSPEMSDISTLPQMPGLELLTRQERTFTATRRIPFGEQTAVAILDGLDDGEAIVITMRVVKD